MELLSPWLARFSGMVADRPDSGIGSEFVMELGEIIVALPGDPVPQPEEQVLAPLGEILDPRRHSLRVQRQAQDVDRLSEKERGDIPQQGPSALVGQQPVPPAIHHQRGIRLVRVEHMPDGFPYADHGRVIEAPAAVSGSKPCGEQQVVAVGQRHVELLREEQDDLPARPPPTRLQKAKVPTGYARSG
jgi:hypothetical protein